MTHGALRLYISPDIDITRLLHNEMVFPLPHTTKRGSRLGVTTILAPRAPHLQEAMKAVREDTHSRSAAFVLVVDAFGSERGSTGGRGVMAPVTYHWRRKETTGSLVQRIRGRGI